MKSSYLALAGVLLLSAFNASELSAQKNRQSQNFDLQFKVVSKRVSGTPLNRLNLLSERVAAKGRSKQAIDDSRKVVIKEIAQLLQNKRELDPKQFKDLKLAISYLGDRYVEFDKSEQIPRVLMRIAKEHERLPLRVRGKGKYDDPKRQVAVSAIGALATASRFSELRSLSSQFPDVIASLDIPSKVSKKIDLPSSSNNAGEKWDVGKWTYAPESSNHFREIYQGKSLRYLFQVFDDEREKKRIWVKDIAREKQFVFNSHTQDWKLPTSKHGNNVKFRDSEAPVGWPSPDSELGRILREPISKPE